MVCVDIAKPSGKKGSGAGGGTTHSHGKWSIVQCTM